MRTNVLPIKVMEAFHLWHSHVATRTPIFIIIKVEEFILRDSIEWTSQLLNCSLHCCFLSFIQLQIWKHPWPTLSFWMEPSAAWNVEMWNSWHHTCTCRRWVKLQQVRKATFQCYKFMTVSASTWKWTNEGPVTVLYSTPSTVKIEI